MKRKSGLHKNVSSIFGGVPVPDNQPVETPAAEDEAVDVGRTEILSSDFGVPDSGGHVGESPRPGPESGPKTAVEVQRELTEDDEYEASQRKKLYFVIGLCCVFALVIYLNFFKSGANKKIAVEAKTASESGMIAKDVEIVWPEPEVWSAQTRDPMVFREDRAKLYVVESKIEGPFVLRGVVYQQPPGRSQALIGIEILYEGEEIQGWIVREISSDSVKLQKPDGEELELKMEYR